MCSGKFIQDGINHIHHGCAVSQCFAGVHPDHELNILAGGKVLHRALNPFGHGLAEHLSPKGQAVSQHIGRQQDNRAFIESQLLANTFAALGWCILPLPGKVLPGLGVFPRGKQGLQLAQVFLCEGFAAMRFPKGIRFVPHDLCILRQPDMLAPVAKLKGRHRDIQIPGNAIDNAHLPKLSRLE